MRAFLSASQANVAVTFALSLIPFVGAIGAAVDYSQANSMKSSMQAAADATALALISQASTLTSAQLNSTASNYFSANFNRPAATNVSASASFSSTTKILTINASATYSTTIMGAMGINSFGVTATSAATMGSRVYPVCVMITNPSSSHTELTANGAGLVLNNCMNQVNTDDWDAVQANDVSYIHGNNADNCFVGEIHFGDVTPPKDATCTLFPDPFAGMTMPSALTSKCDYGWLGSMGPTPKGQPAKMNLTADNQTLQPGSYCQGLVVNTTNNVTFSPGVYLINGGQLQLTGKTNLNVTANGVTFLFTGSGAAMTLQNLTLNMTPSTTAGNFSNFLFFLDQSGCTTDSKGNTTCPYGNKSTWKNVSINSNGIIYLAGQQFSIQGGSSSSSPTLDTLNPGSLIADMILPDGHVIFTLTGYSLNASGAPSSLQKAGANGNSPVLVR